MISQDLVDTAIEHCSQNDLPWSFVLEVDISTPLASRMALYKFDYYYYYYYYYVEHSLN